MPGTCMRFDGAALHNARLGMTISQEPEVSPYLLARIAGLTPGTIIRLERSGGDPSLTTVRNLAQALGVSVDTLLHE
jgi:transcriptional regulator with XRE-family HTH domain